VREKKMATSIERSSLILSANRALWGEVSPAVRAVFVREDGNNVQIQFIMDGPISDEDYFSISRVGSQLAADFPMHQVKESGVRLDLPNPVPRSEGWYLVFMRRDEQAPD
jgi:hypothetical protein